MKPIITARLSLVFTMISMATLYLGSDKELAFLFLIIFLGSFGILIASFVVKEEHFLHGRKKNMY